MYLSIIRIVSRVVSHTLLKKRPKTVSNRLMCIKICIFDTLMELPTKISLFLDSGLQDYDFGMSLLRKVCKNKSLINSLSIKENQSNYQKLNYELNKYLNSISYEIILETEITRRPGEKDASLSTEASQYDTSHEGDQQPIKTGAGSVLSTDTNQHSSNGDHDISSDLLLKVESIKLERNKLYGQRDYYHPQLLIVKTVEGRLEIAQKVLSFQPKIDLFNIEIAEILKTGKLPVLTAEKALSMKDYKRLKLVETYLTRYQRKIKNSTKIEDTLKAETQLERYKTEKEQILSK